MTQVLQIDEKQRLQNLYNKIRENKANSADFYEYESLLEKAGFSKNDLTDEVTKFGFNNWDEFVQQSIQEKDKKDKRNALLIGTILAFGLAILSSDE
ncbi:MAG: hypothetical protein BRD50_06765 [Bacteroidetes bacterium SW_11_45_7]|nr:MAG: hypothetical protein BRD50_06765 [Bacteroidetes bacterium SW_11_45_7]